MKKIPRRRPFLFTSNRSSGLRLREAASTYHHQTGTFSTSRKSQMEILGLTLIIVLLSLGMLFAVRFVLTAPSVDTSTTAKESTIAAHFLNTLLNTNTACQQRTIRELLQDCARTGGIIHCPAANSCDYARTETQHILELSLQPRNVHYLYTIKGSPHTDTHITNGACTTDREAKEHPIPVTPGFDIHLRLEIC